MTDAARACEVSGALRGTTNARHGYPLSHSRGGGDRRRQRGILVVRHARRGERFWTLPGGSSHIGESLDETLKREVGEETGLRVDVGHVVAVFEVGSSPWEPRRLEICLRCKILKEDRSLLLGGDGIVDVDWISPHEPRKDFLPSLLLPLLTPDARGLYLGNITDLEHPVWK